MFGFFWANAVCAAAQFNHEELVFSRREAHHNLSELLYLRRTANRQNFTKIHDYEPVGNEMDVGGLKKLMGLYFSV